MGPSTGPPVRVPLVVLGLGGVGRALLRQVLETRAAVARRAGLVLRPVALADSRGALVDPDGLPDEQLERALEAKEAGASLRQLDASLPRAELVIPSGAIVLDLTASAETGPLLQAALAERGGVVLANKLGLAGPYDEAKRLLDERRLRYEATVGAGLPVIATLQTLLDAGDRVTGVQGVLSGTLAYLAWQLEQDVPYSAAVAQARALGYTEPDPREDLGGRDVARKALIMARTAGWPLEMADLEVEALYPPDWSELSVESFLDRARALDQEYAARVAAAREGGHVLRYTARVSRDGGKVGLAMVPEASGLGALQGTANMISITTERSHRGRAVGSAGRGRLGDERRHGRPDERRGDRRGRGRGDVSRRDLGPARAPLSGRRRAL
jgi:homoserine dehydrogenase